jgi:hypothetical protein
LFYIFNHYFVAFILFEETFINPNNCVKSHKHFVGYDSNLKFHNFKKKEFNTSLENEINSLKEIVRQQNETLTNLINFINSPPTNNL